MRSIIQDQVSHIFIEGAIQSRSVPGRSQERNVDKAGHHADLKQGDELEGDVNDNINDTDSPYYEANERYD